MLTDKTCRTTRHVEQQDKPNDKTFRMTKQAERQNMPIVKTSQVFSSFAANQL
jgi:hypothetical protein